jgi:hypothetical protein
LSKVSEFSAANDAIGWSVSVVNAIGAISTAHKTVLLLLAGIRFAELENFINRLMLVASITPRVSKPISSER